MESIDGRHNLYQVSLPNIGIIEHSAKVSNWQGNKRSILPQPTSRPIDFVDQLTVGQLSVDQMTWNRFRKQRRPVAK